MDGLSLALMFHTSTSVEAGRLGNMASATHTVKSHRMDGWDDEAEDDEEVSHMFILALCTYGYVYYICVCSLI